MAKKITIEEVTDSILRIPGHQWDRPPILIEAYRKILVEKDANGVTNLEKIQNACPSVFFDYIYLMRSENGMTKIGVANNVKSRLSSINCDSADAVSVIHSFRVRKEIAYWAENFFHRLFDQKRVRGEWFNLDESECQKVVRWGEAFQKV